MSSDKNSSSRSKKEKPNYIGTFDPKKHSEKFETVLDNVWAELQ